MAVVATTGWLLASPAHAQERPGEGPIDLGPLFASGALSPGYPRQHERSTARPLAMGSEARPTILTVQVNPALFAFGIWSFRAELALVPYVSVLAEYSRISNFAVPKLNEDIHLDGNLYDLGLHVWPQGDGARGFYVGPRYSFGSGSDRSGYGQGELRGWGVDLGYQWVVGLFAFNLGLGAGPGRATITPSDAVKNDPGIPPEIRALLGEARTTVNFPRPYITIALGAAF
ncbi:MAG: hypothetical protein EOO75_04730 [Myxococcales bacterium]|nr:MAG: hypothetical protein EOO75_04730 [Myxococcales bacterium]